MRYLGTDVAGVVVLEPEPHEDERGLFARTWDPEEGAAHGLNPAVAQCSTSYNRRRGTLRGMHLQRAPHQEAKLVRCTAGAIWDVALDLRPESPTFRQWFGVELTASSRRALYLPEGCAHGFVTLADDSEIFYQISVRYAPSAAAGFRWDDPAFCIAWPIPPVVLSAQDSALPLWSDSL